MCPPINTQRRSPCRSVLLFVTAVSAAVFRAWPTALMLLPLLLLPPRVVVADLTAAVSSDSAATSLTSDAAFLSLAAFSSDSRSVSVSDRVSSLVV